MDTATIMAIADAIDAEATARGNDAHDARHGHGTFAHLVGLPTVDDEIDLAAICTANLIVAHSFGELAKRLRALA